MAVLVFGGCEREQIEVRASPGDGAFGRQELLDALDAFTHSDRSPARFRDLALAIQKLSAQFNDSVRDEAERNLVFVALRTLDSVVEQSMAMQQEALALTVWPSALGMEPAPGESAAVFVERICAAQLALECKSIVPEYQAMMLSALVWQRFEERARAALRVCQRCEGPEYTEPMARYAQTARKLAVEAQQARAQAKPDRWPRGGKNARPWSGAPVVIMDDKGELYVGSELVAREGWVAALKRVRPGSAVLGVHVAPAARVKDLDQLIENAADAGFTQVALQVRAAEYPYVLSEYRLGSSRGTERTVQVRDNDSVQSLVHAVDTLASKDAPLPRI